MYVTVPIAAARAQSCRGRGGMIAARVADLIGHEGEHHRLRSE